MNDVILSINNQPMDSIINLHNMIAESVPGSELIIGITREDQTLSLTAIVKERPRSGKIQD